MFSPPTPRHSSILQLPHPTKTPNSHPVGSLNSLTSNNPAVTEASLIPPPRSRWGGGSQQQEAPPGSSEVNKLNLCLPLFHRVVAAESLTLRPFVPRLCFETCPNDGRQERKSPEQTSTSLTAGSRPRSRPKSRPRSRPTRARPCRRPLMEKAGRQKVRVSFCALCLSKNNSFANNLPKSEKKNSLTSEFYWPVFETALLYQLIHAGAFLFRN